MTTTYVPASSALLDAVLHGAALGGLIAAAVLTWARLGGWRIAEPWPSARRGSLVGGVTGPLCMLLGGVI